MHLALALEGGFAGDGSGWTLSAIADVVQRAEEAGYDFVLLPDTLNASAGDWPDASLLLAWLAASTRGIGLVCCASTLSFEPYTLARRFASLDLISHGRIGWRLPLTPDLAEQGSHSAPRRIAAGDFAGRAEEFVAIVTGLWRGWDSDALVLDKPAGRFFDPAKMHPLNHAGANFNVRGPLNVARSPQGAPLLVIEPRDEAEAALAARLADLVIPDASGGIPGTARVVTMAKIAPPPDAGSLPTTAPARVADDLETLTAEHGYAGFVLPAPSPKYAMSLVDGLLPELRRRGRLTPPRDRQTLRARLGLGPRDAA